MRTESSPYQQLRERITGRIYPPGTMLLPATVGAELGVSRTPVREALHRLDYEGLVVQAPRGYRVRERTPEELLEICDARIVLESAVAFSAATSRSEIDLARLTRMFDTAVAEPDPEAGLRLHSDWHHALRAAAHNRTVEELMDRLDAQMAVYETDRSQAPENLAQIENEHRDILDAVLAGDAERARTTMIAHQVRTRDIRIAAAAAR
ncbi:GntR family transcriptional regulator [Nocardia vermiculata]|uniref:GntR family transcriptional regulator n=1 Tax=Nocardia vermiculata TaxID=257274 RepID=A0A846Y724_9NOCA|nr:GntR family transcriptional regulator [Nocardia vermiculata]NKY54155.1 GntR family transcriptional regulator [Nocardia vermiculata]